MAGRPAGKAVIVAEPRYEIKMRRTHLEVKPAGDFHYRKSFEVKKDGIKQTTGCIVQLVKKKTKVKKHDGTKLTTSEEISEFTGGHVNFMTFDYIEMFIYEEEDREKGFAAGWQEDQFQNGAIVPYNEDGSADLVTNEEPSEYDSSTSGTITMVGEVIYIPERELAEKMGNFKMSDDTHPANKLYVTTPGYWEALKAIAKGPTLHHHVKVVWKEPEHPYYSETILTSQFTGEDEEIKQIKKKAPGATAKLSGRTAKKPGSKSGAAGGGGGGGGAAGGATTGKKKGGRRTRRRRSPQ